MNNYKDLFEIKFSSLKKFFCFLSCYKPQKLKKKKIRALDIDFIVR